MRAQIILKEQTIAVELNPPAIEATVQQEGFQVKVIGGVGPQGPQGYCPVRGIDYWTEEDVEAMTQSAVDRILAIYPAAEEVDW